MLFDKKTAKIDHPVKGTPMLFFVKKMLKFYAQKNLLVFNRKHRGTLFKILNFR